MFFYSSETKYFYHFYYILGRGKNGYSITQKCDRSIYEIEEDKNMANNDI